MEHKLLSGREVVELMDKAIDARDESLEKVLKKSPAYGYTYVQIQHLEIQKIMMNIQLVTLTLSKVAGEPKTTKFK